MNITVLIIAFLAYLIGSIPTGYLIARIKGITDIRKYGSGNIGATNVSRALGKKYFLIIFLLDAGKAFLFIKRVEPYIDFDYLCLLATILLCGNMYSIFLQGSGGKGVATLFGLLSALNPFVTLTLLLLWIVLLFITQTVGIASAGAALLLPLCAYRWYNLPFFLFSLSATSLVLWKHRSNIKTYWKRS